MAGSRVFLILLLVAILLGLACQRQPEPRAAVSRQDLGSDRHITTDAVGPTRPSNPEIKA